MIWVGIIFALLVALVMGILLAKMKIIIEYRNGKTKFVFRSLFLKFTLDAKRLAKFSKHTKSEKKDAESPKTDKTGEESQELTAEGFLEKIEGAKKTFVTVKNVIVEVLEFLGPKVDFREISVKSSFGTGDAAKTGMICGAIWSLSGNVYAFLCRFFRIEYPEISLNPVFDRKFFEIEAYGIIEIRPVHIITAAIRGFKVYDKFKNEKGVDL